MGSPEGTSAGSEMDEALIARSAQFLAVLAMLAESTNRLRAHHENTRAARDEQTARDLRTDRLATRAEARALYAPALDRAWAERATTLDAARVWAASGAWAATDTEAALAHSRAEERLRALHPEAMRRFDQLRQSGQDEISAMRGAAGLFIAPGHHLDQLETPEHTAQARGQARADRDPGTERGGAQDLSTVDDGAAADHTTARDATASAVPRHHPGRPAAAASRWTRRR